MLGYCFHFMLGYYPAYVWQYCQAKTKANRMSKQTININRKGTPLQRLRIVRQCLKSTVADCQQQLDEDANLESTKLVMDTNEEALEILGGVISELKKKGIK
jgi:hypothetical protein